MRRSGHRSGGRRVLDVPFARRRQENRHPTSAADVGRRRLVGYKRRHRRRLRGRRRIDVVAGSPAKRGEPQAVGDGRQQDLRRELWLRRWRRLRTQQLVRGLVAELFARQHRASAVQRRRGRCRRRVFVAANATQTEEIDGKRRAAAGQRHGRREERGKNKRRRAASVVASATAAIATATATATGGRRQVGGRGRGRSQTTATTTTTTASGGRGYAATVIVVQEDTERGQRSTASATATV